VYNSVRRRETTVWMIMWRGSSSISKPNQERRNWRESFLVLVKYKKNLLCFANCKKPIKKARKNYIGRESFSSFLIIGDHKKIWSHAKTIFGTPSLPPPFPPFPPQSRVFQAMRADRSLWIFCFSGNIIFLLRISRTSKFLKKSLYLLLS
jgi:hypothetical protein